MRLLFVVTEDWYFVSHRLPLAVAARAAGYEVTVATRIDRHSEPIRAAGLDLVPLELSRRGGNPLSEIFSLWRLYRRVRPDIVHHVALKPVVYGSIAAMLAGTRAVVNAVAGLGWLFTAAHGWARLARPFLGRALALLLDRSRGITIVQNPEDQAMLQRAGVRDRCLRLIRGSGVDVQAFRPGDPAAGPACVMLVARMLRDKGVVEFVMAARRLAAQGIEARFVLVGDPDPANPATLTESDLLAWDGRDGVEWWGRRDDMPAVWRLAHVACLPSYREGLPKALLEAAATGLPIVATDAPGCREVVCDGDNGLLVPVRDATALAAALRRLITDAELRRRMGARSRQRAEAEFAQEIVIAETLAVYGALTS